MGPKDAKELRAEAERLRAAIWEHRNQRGDDRCWLDDQKLYAAAGLGETDLGETALPPKCDFLASCERYWHERQAPLEHGTAKLPEGMTIRQLTDALKQVTAERDRLSQENAKLRRALTGIADPIAVMLKEAAERGGRLDGVAAATLAKDAGWIKSLAQAALRDTP